MKIIRQQRNLRVLRGSSSFPHPPHVTELRGRRKHLPAQLPSTLSSVERIADSAKIRTARALHCMRAVWCAMRTLHDDRPRQGLWWWGGHQRGVYLLRGVWGSLSCPWYLSTPDRLQDFGFIAFVFRTLYQNQIKSFHCLLLFSGSFYSAITYLYVISKESLALYCLAFL